MIIGPGVTHLNDSSKLQQDASIHVAVDQIGQHDFGQQSRCGAIAMVGSILYWSTCTLWFDLIVLLSCGGLPLLLALLCNSMGAVHDTNIPGSKFGANSQTHHFHLKHLAGLHKYQEELIVGMLLNPFDEEAGGHTCSTANRNNISCSQAPGGPFHHSSTRGNFGQEVIAEFRCV